MNKELSNTLERITLRSDAITEERKRLLQPAIDYITDRQKKNEAVQLNFICTHNSRRSHLAQVLCAFAAKQADVGNIACFSGGTEATRVHPNTLAAMEAMGFHLSGDDEGDNPRFVVDLGDADLLELFSKRYDHEENPEADFAAVMVCSSADTNCPFVPGASQRISVTYDDPKAFDEALDPIAGYVTRGEEIGAEWLYVMNEVSRSIP